MRGLGTAFGRGSKEDRIGRGTRGPQQRVCFGWPLVDEAGGVVREALLVAPSDTERPRTRWVQRDSLPCPYVDYHSEQYSLPARTIRQFRWIVRGNLPMRGVVSSSVQVLRATSRRTRDLAAGSRVMSYLSVLCVSQIRYAPRSLGLFGSVNSTRGLPMDLYIVDCKTSNCTTAHVLKHLGEKSKAPARVEYWISYPLTIKCPTCGASYDHSDSEDKFREKEQPPPPLEHLDRARATSVRQGI